MYKINQIKNYQHFATIIEEETNCSVKIKVMNRDASHVHYQINDRFDMSLGVLCIDNGDISFSPFTTINNSPDDSFINIYHLVRVEDFVKLLSVFSEMFVKDEE